MNWLGMPEAWLAGVAVVLLLVECVAPKLAPKHFATLAMAGVVIVGLGMSFHAPVRTELWNNLYFTDSWSGFFKILFLVSLLGVLWMSREFLQTTSRAGKELIWIPVITTLGLFLTASAVDFILLFAALELVTISFYILIALQRSNPSSLEAGVKYLIIGALSTAFWVYGIALLYGTAGSTHFSEIARHMNTSEMLEPTLWLAIACIGAGILFKMAAVPFHAWAPDVYEGAPTPVAAFLATASKMAGVLLTLRIFFEIPLTTPHAQTTLQTTLGWIGAVSLILGSLSALPQTNLKRLLGYSSIANAGFLLLMIQCFSVNGMQAMHLYLCVYLPSVLLVFAVISILGIDGKEEELRGLARRNPGLALSLAIGLISLLGLPMTAGFWGKLGLFLALWSAGNFGWLTIAVIGAAAGFYYYLKFVYMLYAFPPKEESTLSISRSAQILIALLTAGILILGIWPAPVMNWISF